MDYRYDFSFEQLDSLPKFEQKVKFCLYKLGQRGGRQVALGEVSKWVYVQNVPPALRGQLLKDLYDDVRAQELTGKAAYFANLSMEAKLNLYAGALEELKAEAHADGQMNEGLTWAEFRRRVGRKVMEAAKYEQDDL